MRAVPNHEVAVIDLRTSLPQPHSCALATYVVTKHSCAKAKRAADLVDGSGAAPQIVEAVSSRRVLHWQSSGRTCGFGNR